MTNRRNSAAASGPVEVPAWPAWPEADVSQSRERTMIRAMAHSALAARILSQLPGSGPLYDRAARIREWLAAPLPELYTGGQGWFGRLLAGESIETVERDIVLAEGVKWLRYNRGTLVYREQTGSADALAEFLQQAETRAAAARLLEAELREIVAETARVLTAPEPAWVGPTPDEVRLNAEARRLAPQLGIEPPTPLELQPQPTSNREQFDTLVVRFEELRSCIAGFQQFQSPKRWPVDVLDNPKIAVRWDLSSDAPAQPWEDTPEVFLTWIARTHAKLKIRTHDDLKAIDEQIEADRVDFYEGLQEQARRLREDPLESLRQQQRIYG